MSEVTPINSGDTAFVLLSAATVFLMAPGCGYFYSGTVEFKNSLSIILLSFLIYAVVTIQWYLFGFSLSFSDSGNGFIGNFDLAVMNKFFDTNVRYPTAQSIPPSAFVVYQGMFAAVTPVVAFAAVAERLRIVPFLVFVFIWSTVVYNPICYWVFAPTGWLATLGVQDFAGGIPVHVVAGMTGLALCLSLGPRRSPHPTPHSLPFVTLGTVLLWFGWLFFNAGSAAAANGRAALAFLNTNLAGCVGGLTWLFFDYRIHQKTTTLGFCSGAVAALACVTPASGFVLPHFAMIFGFVGAICANLACYLKGMLGYDDSLDTFPVHAVAGAVGTIMTGFFSSQYATSQGEDFSIAGGAMDQEFHRIWKQLVGVLVAAGWTFCVTYALTKVFESMGHDLRVTKEEEIVGCDITLCGEVAYDYTNTSGDSEEVEA